MVVHRNDKIAPAEVMAAEPEAIVLSPGPCTPNEAGICLDLIDKAAPTIPILGVCLGHQAIGQAFGGKVVRAHARARQAVARSATAAPACSAASTGRFRRRAIIRWWSSAHSMPRELDRQCRDRRGLVMGLEHESLPVHGVQFHPESIASEHGHLILKNFLDIAAAWNKQHRPPHSGRAVHAAE